MKQLILLTAIGFICLTMKAQTVSLGTHQNYIPIITQHGDTLVSSIADGNQWYKNDVAIEGATAQSYICTETANYKVVATYAATGCRSSSEKYDFKTALSNINPDFYYKVYPNPCNGLFNIQFDAEITGGVQFELYYIDGRLVMTNRLESIAGKQIVPFGDSGLVKGVYSLRIRTSKGIVNHLIVLQ